MDLNKIMQMDHVIQVHPDGSVTDAPADVYGPEVYDGDQVEQEGGWILMNGYSGQYGYSGPTMHASEYVGGRLAEAILETPGYYVATVPGDTEQSAGWCVAFKEAL